MNISYLGDADRHHPPVAYIRKRELDGVYALIVPIVLFLLLLAAAGCARPAAQPGEPPPPKVTVAAVLVKDVTEWDEFTGRLEAVNTVAVRPRVSGSVSGVRFREGAIVNRGDLLFQIDARPFQAEVDRLKAEVTRARATVQRASSEAQRAERLTAQDAMSREESDRRASFAQEATAQVEAVAAALRAAELNLEFTRVTSPIAGRVGRAIATEGNLVSAGPGEATLLTTVVSLDPIYAAFDVDEQSFLRYGNLASEGRRASARQPGLPIQMALAGEPAFPHQGKMNFLDNQVDPETGTIRARAVFTNPDLDLTPGLFVRLRLPGTAAYDGALVRDAAIGTDLDKRYVLVVTQDRTVEYRPVTLGPNVGTLRVVRSGLAAGELVVVNGLQRVRPGMKVDPVVAAMEPASGTPATGAAAAPATAGSERRMKFSQFFIDRPIFAAVLSLLIVVGGTLSLPRLPISEYPSVVPPTVVVRGVYPGANPKVIAETVASPLEQQLNGVEGLLYMFSQATADGRLTLTVTFALGTDLDNAQVQVQNRVSQALPRLPPDVQRIGVTTEKASPDFLLVAHLVSPDERYDMLYLSNFAYLQVKDELARIPGVGSVQIFGAGEYSMRVWLDPDKLAARQLTATDVVRAIREQNVQVAAGALGAPPAPSDTTFQLSVNAQGRLASEEEFSDIVVRATREGQITRLGDIGRVELGSNMYALRSLLDNKPAVAIGIAQRPGSNALEASAQVREVMERLEQTFPAGVEYRIVYDPTVYVRESIRAVVETLFEAILLVVIVVMVFLQTWRASIIPLVAVPVSLIGTFAVMLGLGFSLNTLSLFGLVLSIGIVVDDAIVVVENVERHIELGLSPIEASRKAMNEVSGPIIAIALVLCAVFVPTAFISGLTGQFYRQFALTIAISTVISAFNSLTLSPALASRLLRAHGTPRDRVQRMVDRLFGWFFRLFNRFFTRSSAAYASSVARLLRVSFAALVLYVGLVGVTVFGFSRVPQGFVPAQDKDYLVAFAQLPDAATLDRTDAVIRQMSKLALEHPGVSNAVAFPGLSVNGFVNASNAGIVFVILKPSEERKSPGLAAAAIVQELNAKFGGIEEAFVAIFPPPPVQGLGTVGGFKLYVEDRAALGFEELYQQVQGAIGAGYADGRLTGLFSSFQVSVPQIDAHVDRERAKTYGVALTDVFETLQVYLGSLYVNDFNRFGRTYQVNVQAESRFRLQPEQIAGLKTRNAAGAMTPLGSLVTVGGTYGPDQVMHYNGFPAAEINGAPVPGVSSSQAQQAITDILASRLPRGMAHEWTELAYQEQLAGNTMLLIFPLCVLLVYVVLAAQYESWSLPLSVILIVPMTILSAITGVLLTAGDNNVFTQISFLVLAGLACKNAILIVEFARQREDEGEDHLTAILDACRVRLRPVLMTSVAFIMGVVPLVIATGAGFEIRRAMGVAVFAGMLGVTAFGLFLTPVFYTVVGRLAGRVSSRTVRAPAAPSLPAAAEGH